MAGIVKFVFFPFFFKEKSKKNVSAGGCYVVSGIGIVDIIEESITAVGHLYGEIKGTLGPLSS